MNTHPTVVSVDALAAELLDLARQHTSRRTARTLVAGTMQRATLIALAEGAELAKHDSPPAATLFVVTGTARLHTHSAEHLMSSGQLIALPPDRHSLTAVTDTAVLLTVALH